MSSLLKHILRKLLINHFYRRYVVSNALIKMDVFNTIQTRGCKVDVNDDKEMFKHLMLYYPEFAFVFFWRINKRNHRYKHFFTSNFHCKIFASTKIDGGLMCYHPFASVINAKSIGKNFQFRNTLTVGNKANNNQLLPVIGNNVSVGSNVVIIGAVTVGDNVTIGAGSVVVKDIPSDVVVAGNPAKIIRKLTNE